jgi:hypothetical protein
MEFAEAAAHEQVVDGLRGIEDKILETGQLVTATGDAESDLTLCFLVADIGNGPTPYLVIDITTGAAIDDESDAWVGLSDYVYSKFLDLSGSLPRRTISVLREAVGQLTRVNGKPILMSNW